MEDMLFADVVQSFECLNASLVNFLRIWGCKVAPEEIFFCGNGFSFRIENRHGFKHLVSDVYISSFRYMDKMKISYNHEFLKDTSKTKQFVCEAIMNKRFLALKVRSDYLTYNKVFKQTVANHYIDIIEYNKETNELFVVDGDVPTMKPSSYAGWVDMDTIVDGWEKTNYEYIEFFPPEHLPEVIDTQFISVIISQLNNYLLENSDDIGADTVLLLFEQITELRGDELAKVTKEINYQLRVDGFFASREYLLNCLTRYDGFDELIQTEKSILQKWNLVCMLCIKISISRKLEEITKLIHFVQSLIIMEKDVFGEVVNKLSCILN